MTETNRQVSFDSEKLIVVDEQDNILGYKSKAECHDGDGILHRAFSIFIFNENRQLLMQKRSHQKRLWANYWSNSCCSHPRQGETNEIATQRRLKEELDIEAPLKYLFKFQYHARFGKLGSENELCSVYIGKTSHPIHANPNEISEWEYMDLEDLERDLQNHPDNYTPWFKMEWERIRSRHLQDIEALFQS